MDQERIQKLISELQNGTDQKRRSASYKLRKYKDVSVVQALIEACQDTDGSVRQNAIEGLQIIGTQEAQNYLISHGYSIQAPKSTEVKTVLLASLIVVIGCIILVFLYVLVMSRSLSRDCFWQADALTYKDLNADGIYQEAEPPMEGVQLSLFVYYKGGGQKGSVSEFITGKDGMVNVGTGLPGCPKVTFKLVSELPDGYEFTTPGVFETENYVFEDPIPFGFAQKKLSP